MISAINKLSSRIEEDVSEFDEKVSAEKYQSLYKIVEADWAIGGGDSFTGGDIGKRSLDAI